MDEQHKCTVQLRREVQAFNDLRMQAIRDNETEVNKAKLVMRK